MATASSRSRSCPRLLRESPLNAIWEGSGNVIALDVLRAARTHPEAVEALRAELAKSAVGGEALADELVRASEGEARRVAETVGMHLQAGLLVENASPEVADAFVSSRIEGSSGSRLYGTLPFHQGLSAIVERAIPA